MTTDQRFVWMVRIRPGGIDVPVADDELAKLFMEAGCKVVLESVESLDSPPELLRATVLRQRRER